MSSRGQRAMGKRAQAAAAAQLAAVAAAARLEQQELQRLHFLKRSLQRNDVEIAALQDLHLTINTAKRQVLKQCSHMHYSGCSCHYHHSNPTTASDGTNDDKDEKDVSKKNNKIAEETDCLLLLDLGQGKIRLTADKEGLEDDSNNNTDNNNNTITSLVATLSPQAYHWSLDFLLRLQLRRQLMNRLVRRLQRMAVVMDAVAAAELNTNDSNNQKGDAAAAAALVHPPAPPKYGDLCLHIDAQEIQEFAQHWARQEGARQEMEASRECFYEKQHALATAAAADADLEEAFPPLSSTLADDDEEENTTAAAAAADAVQSTSKNPDETVSSSPEKQLHVPDPAAATSSPVKQEEAFTETSEKDGIAPTTKGETTIGQKKLEDDKDVPMEDAASDDKKSTTAIIPSSEQAQSDPSKDDDTKAGSVDDVPMKDAAADGDHDDVDDKKISEYSTDKADEKPPSSEQPANVKASVDSSQKADDEKKPPAAAITVSSSTNNVAGTDNAAAMAETNQGTADDDEDDEEGDDTGNIDYEAFREYMNAYEKIVDPTTGQVQYTLLADAQSSSSSDPNSNASKTTKKKKHSKIPDLSAFANSIGIGAVNPHRVMSLQEVQAEYERWSGALLARLPCQPTLTDLGLQNQVHHVKERRRRALLAAATAAEAEAAAAAAAAASSTRLSFVSPGKKLRNKQVEEEDDTKEDDDDDDDDDTEKEEEEALTAPPTPSAFPGKKLRNKDDEDAKEDVAVEGEDAKEDVDQEDAKKDTVEQEDTKKDTVEQDADTKMDEKDVEMTKSDHDDDRMDVDEKEAEEEPKESPKDDPSDNAKEETKDEDGDVEAKTAAKDVPSGDKDKQEHEDEKEKEKIDSADEEEEEQTDDEDNEESQHTKPDDDDEEDDDKDTEDIDSTSSKNDAMADDQPEGDKPKEEEDDEEEPPVNLKKRPIILAPVPSFHDQDLKRVRLVHAELMSASIRAHASRRIKDSTQEYNTALQLSREIFTRQQRMQAQLHHFAAEKRSDMVKAQNQYGVDYAVAKAQWNKRRLAFEEKKLDRLMPKRKDAGHRPDGTTMTKMYSMQPDPAKQCIASTVAEIIDSVELMATCRMPIDQFEEPFQPPPRRNSNSLEDQNRNNQVEATMRQEIAKLGIQLRSTEEDRSRAWRRMLKIQGEFTAVMNNRSTDMLSYPLMPLPDLRQSSHQSIPLEAAAGAHMGMPSYVPTRVARHPVVRRSPLAAGAAASAFGVGGSDSKYSIARVRERIYSDGTVAPVTAPKKNKDGLYARPAGRTRKGMEWDAVRGVWKNARRAF